MRGRLNILAFNLPENNSDSPELSRWQPVTQSTLLRPEALLAGDVQLPGTATSPPPTMAFYVSVAVVVFQEAPTNKLLYAKDIPTYKEEVKSYYKAIRDLPPLSSLEMEEFLTQESKVLLKSGNKLIIWLVNNMYFRAFQQTFLLET